MFELARSLPGWLQATMYVLLGLVGSSVYLGIGMAFVERCRPLILGDDTDMTQEQKDSIECPAALFWPLCVTYLIAKHTLLTISSPKIYSKLKSTSYAVLTTIVGK